MRKRPHARRLKRLRITDRALVPTGSTGELVNVLCVPRGPCYNRTAARTGVIGYSSSALQHVYVPLPPHTSPASQVSPQQT